ncbi:MAG TPA: DUF6153 family protein [Mycobacterium sp.]|nr:DUF6153 family protein [Mycobacterium sp.]
MTRYQWWLIVFIAAGLVGMHHLVHAPTAQTMPMTTASATPIQHGDPEAVGITPVEATSTSVVASQTDFRDPMDLVGHACLAVLIAIVTLAAALIVAAAWHRPREPGHLLAAVIALGARGPPLGCPRLAQLCVLRR